MIHNDIKLVQDDNPLTHSNAFTLSEVLITLGVIGVVAAFTIPVLINNYKQKQNIVAFKKILSELSQISQQLSFDYSGNWTNECTSYNNECFMRLFKSKMKNSVVKTCENRPIQNGCIIQSKYLNNENCAIGICQDAIDHTNLASFITSGGYSLSFRFHNQGCPLDSATLPGDCGWIQIDVNGLKKPNIIGKDVFIVTLRNKGIIIIKGYGSASGDFSSYEEDCKNGTGIYCPIVYTLK